MESNYYYVIEGSNINKYLVNFNIEELKKLRWDIINNCSNIVHMAYRTFDEPDYFDTDHIREYRSRKLGFMTRGDFYSGGSVECFVEYDYYEHSKLVEILDNLLKGNMKSLDELFNFSSTYGLKLDTIRSKIEIDKIDALANSYIFKVKKNKSDLEVIENIYVDKVKKCIDLNLMASISTEIFECVRDFFDDSIINKNVSGGLKRVLKVGDK